MGAYCSMDPRSSDFKFQIDYSPGYSGIGDDSSVVGVYAAPCSGIVSKFDGTSPESISSAPCCHVVLCGSANVNDCSGLSITRSWIAGSASPSASASPSPGSSATPTATPSPASEYCSGASTAAPLEQGDYRLRSCAADGIAGGTVSVVVSNPDLDSLGVYVASGTMCGINPQNKAGE